MKFKRMNALDYQEQNKIPYPLANIITQTNVECLVEMANKKELNANQLKKIIMNQVEDILDQIIKEETR